MPVTALQTTGPAGLLLVGSSVAASDLLRPSTTVAFLGLCPGAVSSLYGSPTLASVEVRHPLVPLFDRSTQWITAGDQAQPIPTALLLGISAISTTKRTSSEFCTFDSILCSPALAAIRTPLLILVREDYLSLYLIYACITRSVIT